MTTKVQNKTEATASDEGARSLDLYTQVARQRGPESGADAMAEWYQQALTTPEVLEVNIRVGLIPEQDHVQVLAEMKDPTTGVLVAQWSMPHTTMHRLPRVLDDARRRIDAWLGDACEPF